jgi:hypothetical protein
MTRWIYLRTDDRAMDVVRHFEVASGWELVGPVDSANWGEGYDLKWTGVPVRLHDAERSDEVVRRCRGACPPGEWDRLFEVVAGEMAGEATLGFVIDYWGEAGPDLYSGVAEAIRAVLLGAGYDLNSIKGEAAR